MKPQIPKDWPVQPLKPGQAAKDRATCGGCGLSWDDGIITSMTPTPSARCPFEAFHDDPEPPPAFRYERYGRRNWAVYEGDTLVVVAVYKKGAKEVIRRLTEAV